MRTEQIKLLGEDVAPITTIGAVKVTDSLTLDQLIDQLTARIEALESDIIPNLSNPIKVVLYKASTENPTIPTLTTDYFLKDNLRDLSGWNLNKPDTLNITLKLYSLTIEATISGDKYYYYPNKDMAVLILDEVATYPTLLDIKIIIEEEAEKEDGIIQTKLLVSENKVDQKMDLLVTKSSFASEFSEELTKALSTEGTITTAFDNLITEELAETGKIAAKLEEKVSTSEFNGKFNDNLTVALDAGGAIKTALDDKASTSEMLSTVNNSINLAMNTVVTKDEFNTFKGTEDNVTLESFINQEAINEKVLKIITKGDISKLPNQESINAGIMSLDSETIFFQSDAENVDSQLTGSKLPVFYVGDNINTGISSLSNDEDTPSTIVPKFSVNRDGEIMGQSLELPSVDNLKINGLTLAQILQINEGFGVDLTNYATKNWISTQYTQKSEHNADIQVFLNSLELLNLLIEGNSDIGQLVITSYKLLRNVSGVETVIFVKFKGLMYIYKDPKYFESIKDDPDGPVIYKDKKGIVFFFAGIGYDENELMYTAMAIWDVLKKAYINLISEKSE